MTNSSYYMVKYDRIGMCVLRILVTVDRVPDRVPGQVLDQVPGQVLDRAPDQVPDPGPGLVPAQALVVDRARCSVRVPRPERRLRLAEAPLQLEPSLRGLLS